MLSQMSKKKKAGFYAFDGTEMLSIDARAFTLGRQSNYTQILRKGTQIFNSNFGVDLGITEIIAPKKKVNLLDEYYWN